MIEQYLNFESKGTRFDFFSITEERINEFNEVFNVLVLKEVESNMQYYSYEDEDGTSLHAGRIIQYALTYAKTPNEQLAVFFAGQRIVEGIAAKIKLKKQIDLLNQIIKTK